MVDLVVDLATANVHNLGGPFGAALISPDGTRFHHGTNRVTASSDPTAHAEVTAIRNACEAERTHDLTGWTLVTSCYPCPMCLGAALWARVDRIVYAATPDEAAAAGFDDRAFHDEARRRSGRFECLFERPDGLLTEGSFTNLFVERDGLLLTPPQASGALPGVLRAELLASGRAREAVLYPADLGGDFWLGNALRGLIPVRLKPA